MKTIVIKTLSIHEEFIYSADKVDYYFDSYNCCFVLRVFCSDGIYVFTDLFSFSIY